MSDAYVMLARLESELKHVIEAMNRQETAANDHRDKVEKSLANLASRVTSIETQLTGSKGFVKGVRFAFFIIWSFIVAGGVTVIHKLMEVKW